MLRYKEQSYRAILFDLDGTLLDTAADLGAAVNKMLVNDNLAPLSQQVIFHTASQGAIALIKAGYGDNCDIETYQNMRTTFLDNYQNNIAVHTCYFDGVQAMLATLDELKIPWGIVTNKPTLYTELLLAHFPVLANCAAIVCGDTLAVHKPDPAPLLLAATQMGIKAQEFVYVGDARTDMIASNAANMLSVAANYGYIPPNDPCIDWPSAIIIDQASDLLTILKAL
ncbi:MAG: HAD-IA family hydrolase [Psychrobium sp.]|nr:HAD-IA family hydrolase [Psychrobium sp.]